MTSPRSQLSIQEALFPELTCFGCGHANPDGFHLRSYRHGDRTVATFTPLPKHDNGFGFLNGGIITTVLDCHTAAVVMWEADQRGWKADKGAPVPFITAGLEVKFLRPTPLGRVLSLRAVPEKVSESEVIVNAELVFDEKPRATLRAQWLRFRPR
jgi:acyl-coenzyme A thioesterase PaaI-like protein